MFRIDYNPKEELEYIKKLQNRLVPSKVKKGLRLVGDRIRYDVMNVEPTVPERTGRLRESFFANVVADSTGVDSALSGIGTVTSSIFRNKTSYDLEFGFDDSIAVNPKTGFPYAVAVHNMEAYRTVNWTLPGSGSWFLSSKMELYINDYTRILRETVMELTVY